ncbi:MAG TPA: zinc-ribbon domain-containing protein, partial [Candidatus Nitrosopelagicus sp.]|nr:zinc-ribbon domain-containing protein [Candidatus Nitrosopelagicus sp.]
ANTDSGNETKFCSECGQKISVSARFCTECGAVQE